MRNSRKYDHRIEVYQQAETFNSFAGNTLNGSPMAKAWADIKTIRTDKMEDYGLNEVQGGIRLFVRNHDDIDWNADDIYIVYKGRDWFINSVMEHNLWSVEYEIVASHG